MSSLEKIKQQNGKFVSSSVCLSPPWLPSVEAGRALTCTQCLVLVGNLCENKDLCSFNLLTSSLCFNVYGAHSFFPCVYADVGCLCPWPPLGDLQWPQWLVSADPDPAEDTFRVREGGLPAPASIPGTSSRNADQKCFLKSKRIFKSCMIELLVQNN